MGAQIKLRKRYRTDWFRVIVQLQYQGYSQARVARILGVSLTTLRGWKDGSEPAHNFGHALLELWSEVIQQPICERPMTFD